MSESAADTQPAAVAPAPVPMKGTFRRPARANVKAAAVAPAEGPTVVPVGFRTHSDAAAEEGFLFSTKTLPPPSGQNEVIIELVSSAQQLSAIPKPSSFLDASASTHMLASMTQGASQMGEGRTPNGWICRAYCKDEKHAQHALGAISVHQRLMDIRFLSDNAKNKAHARILTFSQAQEWYGAAFVELTIQDQFVSRSDMFLITEAMRDRVLYLGQELTYEGFRLRVSDMLASSHGPLEDKTSFPNTFEKLPSGLVTPATKINFLSLSYVYTIMIELSTEMWDQSLDGRVLIDWAIERFLKEHSEQFPKYRSNPTVRFVFFGRLRAEHAVPGPSSPHGPSCSLNSPGVPESIQRDLFHSVVVPQTQTDLQRLSEIAKSHLEVFLDRIAELTQVDGVPVHPRDLFTPARYSNLLPALNIVLEFYNHHHLDRRLDVTGQAITVITAGNGLYHVANDLSQITATKMLDIGIRKCMIICMGRPPLHKAPLLEYCSDDTSLRSQYQLQLDPRARERFYERPLWAECYFYHPLLHRGPVGAGYSFALLSKEQWEKEFPYIRERQHRYHTGLLLPALPKPRVVCRAAPLLLSIPVPTDSADNMPKQRDAQVFVRPAEPKVASVASYQQFVLSTTPQRGVAPRITNKQMRMSTTLAVSRKSGVLGGDLERKATLGLPFVESRWYKHVKTSHDMEITCQQNEFAHIVSTNVLDEDLVLGFLRLDLTINTAGLSGWAWNPELLTKPTLWTTLLSCFTSSIDDVSGDLNFASTPGPRGGLRQRGSRWKADNHFASHRCRIHRFTLSLYTKKAPNVAFDFAEDLLFAFHPDLFIVDEAPSPECSDPTLSPSAQPHADSGSKPMAVNLKQTMSLDAGEGQSMAESMNPSMFRPKAGQVVSMGSIQIRSSILFAVQPTNPFDDTGDANVQSTLVHNDGVRRTADVYVSAAKVQQLRWQAAHPERRLEAVWAILCTVPILPLYGQRPEYSQDSMRDDGRRQYWMNSKPQANQMSRGSHIPLQIKEYLLQRLHQQYQIVSVRHQGSSTVAAAGHQDGLDGAHGGLTTVTTASGSSWSRRLQPLEEVEVTIGHQNQTLKIADDGKGIYVQRSLHKGMYESNTAHLVAYEFMLLNHSDLSFHPRVVKLEAAIGERARFDWRSLDEYLCQRDHSTIPNAALRDRQVCFVLLPSERSSDRRRKPVVPFDAFKAFVTSRFSTKLKPREGTPDDLWVFNNEPLEYASNSISALATQEPGHAGVEAGKEFLKTVALEHNKDDPMDAPDRILRRPVDTNNGQTNHDVFIDDRVMGADIDLSPYYHEECAYVMRLSWLCCASTIISDWTKGLQHNASKYGIRVVQVPCTYDITQCGCHLQSQFHAMGDLGMDEERFRSDLMIRLAKEYGYFPEVREMNRNCRLVHTSGLCFVASLPDHQGLVWSENYVWKSGNAEQRALLEDFRNAVAETNRSLRKQTMMT